MAAIGKKNTRAARLRELFDRFSRSTLHGLCRSAGVPLRRDARKDELLDVLCTLEGRSLEDALVKALTKRDLQALCRKIGFATGGPATALAARLVAAVEDPSARLSRFRPFTEARAFAQSLLLDGQSQWRAFTRGTLPEKGHLPDDIPKWPHLAYQETGWTSWGDFLGTGNPARHLIAYRPFHEARAFARSLGLANVDEWRAFCKSRKGNRRVLPADIPSAPHKVYAEWISYGDWLGTGRVGVTQYHFRSYTAARRFVQRLGLKSETEWRAYCRGEIKKHRPRPLDIPSNPHRTYKNSGWTTWGRFLGSNYVAAAKRKFRSFEDARAYVRKQGIKDNKAWRAWCRAGQRPADIPAGPDHAYRDRGWTSWGDFLGNGNVHRGRIATRSFAEARAFVHTLGLTSGAKFQRAKHAGRIPEDIPVTIFRHPEWKGWADFLGLSETRKPGSPHPK
ncbi:MAG: hypothetical protein HY698_14045 [Deltaproteobacteria bacterium]|nr:hypothetical protein [Deltaproteobacteria bacterium]